MSEMIAYCGIDCYECGAFVSTRDNDDAKRREVAELWSKEFLPGITAEDINCEGCLSDGVLFSYCYDCKIRACAMERGFANCALCDDYVCEKLSEIFAVAPEAKERLDSLRT
jgi:hypothetical protein